MRSGVAARLGAGVLGVVGMLGFGGAPAAAHGGEAPDGTAYRTVVTGIEHPMPGLTVRGIEAGARLELINQTGRSVEILGYAGEPYLRVGPDGTYVNVHSPAAYRNETVAADTAVPAVADPAAPPQWRRVSTDARVRWHDARTHWTSADLPAPARTDPDRTHRLRDWSVPLRDGVRTFEVRGTLDWVPPPHTELWWLGALLVAAGCLLVRRAPAALATIAAVCATTTIGYAIARESDAGVPAAAALPAALTGAHLTAMLAALGVLTAAALQLARRPAANFALALAGTALAVFAGFADAGVFTAAVLPAPGPAWWPRVAVLLAIGGGAGLAAVGMLRLRASSDPSPARARWSLASRSRASTSSTPSSPPH